jgi:hypothetical protein
LNYLGVCGFCFFLERRRRRNDFLDRRLDFCCLDGCDFGVVFVTVAETE